MRMILNNNYFLLLLTFVLTQQLSGKQLISLQDALHSTFPNAQNFKRETVYFSQEELNRIQRINKTKQAQIKKRLFIRYKAVKNKKVIGYSYIDTHRVRTLSETTLISINKEGVIHKIEVLNFREPNEYLAPAQWLAQFREKSIANSFILKKDIYGITGASLTAQAIEYAVSRVLAIHRFIKKE